MIKVIAFMVALAAAVTLIKYLSSVIEPIVSRAVFYLMRKHHGWVVATLAVDAFDADIKGRVTRKQGRLYVRLSGYSARDSARHAALQYLQSAGAVICVLALLLVLLSGVAIIALFIHEIVDGSRIDRRIIPAVVCTFGISFPMVMLSYYLADKVGDILYFEGYRQEYSAANGYKSLLGQPVGLRKVANGYEIVPLPLAEPMQATIYKLSREDVAAISFSWQAARRSLVATLVLAASLLAGLYI